MASLEYKPLNAKNVAILKSVYAVQDENLKLLKSTNVALQENATLLRARIQELLAEVAALRCANQALHLKLPPDVDYAPSPTAWDILATFAASDASHINATGDLAQVLKPQRDIEAALEELCTAGVMENASLGDHGCWLKPTPYGKDFVRRPTASHRPDGWNGAEVDGRRAREGVR